MSTKFFSRSMALLLIAATLGGSVLEPVAHARMGDDDQPKAPRFKLETKIGDIAAANPGVFFPGVDAGADPKVEVKVEKAYSLENSGTEKEPRFIPITANPEIAAAAMPIGQNAKSIASKNDVGDCHASEVLPEEPGKPKRHLFWITVGLMATQVGVVALMTKLPEDSTGWHNKGSIATVLGHLSLKDIPHYDNDPFYWNYVAHPIVGSEYYLLARNRDATWWQSLFYAAGMSTFWEFVTEGYFERPSVQDLIITPVAGAVVGELRYQAKKALVDPKTGKATGTFKKVLVVILDPVEALSGP